MKLKRHAFSKVTRMTRVVDIALANLEAKLYDTNREDRRRLNILQAAEDTYNTSYHRKVRNKKLLPIE